MSDDRRSQVGIGVLVAVVSVAVLTAFSSVAPAAIHKLILFSITFGICVGGILAWTAKEFGITRTIGLPLTVLLIVCGLTAIALSRHQQLRQQAQSAIKKDAKQMLALNMLKSAAAEDPEMAADYQRHQRRVNPTFADYLAIRIRPLGEWPQPWPVHFWAGELLLATLAGVFIVHRRLAATAHETENEA